MTEPGGPVEPPRAPGGPSGPGASVEPPRPPARPNEPSPERRPIIERIGLAAIAVVLAILFGGVAAASWIGGEPFLAVMGAAGCLMTLWVGAMTVIRG
jgi:hypothetical protein